MIAGNPPDAPIVAGLDRVTLVTYVVLLLITAAAWIQILSSGLQADDMAGMSMASAPTLAEGALYVAAWTVMMAAMMLPSAAPMIALYAATQRNEGTALVRLARVALFALTYLSLWALTGVPTYLASVALGAVTTQALAYVVAGLLVAAGLFQLSPLKQVCLELPEPRRIPSGSLALGLARRPRDGLGPRGLLRGLLLGADGRAGRGRRDGSALGSAHRRRRGGGKASAAG